MATYYSYDDIYQLTAETQLDSGGQAQYTAEYDYDAAQNRTVKTIDGTSTSYTYNAANELLTETTGGQTTYYHYDGCGNTVAKQETGGTTDYVYDVENLLTRIDFAAGGHSYYTYDADSKRVSQQTVDGFRQFVYQGPDMLKLQLERDESEDTVAQYTMGNGLESMRRSDASSFYHYNHLGTTLALTGADEAVTDGTTSMPGGCCWAAAAARSIRIPMSASSATTGCPTPTCTTSALETMRKSWEVHHGGSP